MAFHITQCPNCESTFNTSPQMLEMAAGKVRCGACLTVFQADDHFVDTDNESNAAEAEESVFIGNDPQDYFDPTVFLTRSALQDDQTVIETPATETPLPDLDAAATDSETVTYELDGAEDQPAAFADPDSADRPSRAENISPASAEDLTSTTSTESGADTVGISAAGALASTGSSDSEPANNTVEDLVETGRVAESGEEVVEAAELQSADRELHADFFAAIDQSLDTPIEDDDDLEELERIARLNPLKSAPSTFKFKPADTDTLTETQVDTFSEISFRLGPGSGEPESDESESAWRLSEQPGQEEQTESESALKPEAAAPGEFPAEIHQVADESQNLDHDVSPTVTLEPDTNLIPPGSALAGSTPESIPTEPVAPPAQPRPEDVSLSVSFSLQQRSPTLRTTTVNGEQRPDSENETTIPQANTAAELNIDTPPGDAEADTFEPAFTEPEIDPASEFAERTLMADSATTRAAELAEQDFNEVIEVQDFAETVASGVSGQAEQEIQEGLTETNAPANAKHPGEELNTRETDGSEDNLAEAKKITALEASTTGLEQPSSWQLSEAETSESEAEAGAATNAEGEIDQESVEEETIATDSLNTEAVVSSAESVEVTPSSDAPTEDNTFDQQEPGFADEIERAEALVTAEEDSSEAIRARALRTLLEDEEALEQLPEENLAALQTMATPLELGSSKRQRWGKNLGLGLLALILGAGIAGQYLWRNKTALSQEPRLRPLYAWSCEQFGCSLDPYSHLSAIVSSNLSVRSHPERADAIMVNVELRNTAAFEQAFPVLVLGFNTASNDLVALREFSPDEYLDAGLRDIRMMPVMAPVQIDLALMDPGPDAVNYTLAFRLP